MSRLEGDDDTPSMVDLQADGPSDSSTPGEVKKGEVFLTGVRSRVKSVAEGKMDPREAYRRACNPDDPLHRNFPQLTASREEPLVPVLLSDVGRPTLSDVREGAGPACKVLTKLIAPVFCIWVALLASDAASVPPPAPDPCNHFGPETTAQYNAGCNNCENAYDFKCDEGYGVEAGSCDKGSDSADCFSNTQALGALQDADLSDTELGYNFILLLLFGGLPAIILPCLAGMACCVPSLAQFRLSVIPVVSDMVFEAIHTRGLAVLETCAIFLLIVGYTFDTKLCGATFAIKPKVHDIETDLKFPDQCVWEACPNEPPYHYVDSTGEPLETQPPLLPKKTVSMRDDDWATQAGMVILFVLRFIFCNLANSRWQSTSKITRSALVVAIVFSLWSLVTLGNDAQFCRYPTEVDSEDDKIVQYCTIYAEEIPGGSMGAKDFFQTEDGCEAGRKTGWADMQVGFNQLYDPTTFTPQSQIKFADPVAEDLLPSRARVFDWQMYNEADGALVSPEQLCQNDPAKCACGPRDPCYFDTMTINQETKNYFCGEFAYGSMMEAVASYATACEDNLRMRDSTLQSWTQLLLNIVELVVLVVMWTKQSKGHMFSRSTGAYPIRLLGAVAVTGLLLLSFLADIDLIALQTEQAIEKLEANLDNSGYEHKARPPFSSPGEDCPGPTTMWEESEDSIIQLVLLGDNGRRRLAEATPSIDPCVLQFLRQFWEPIPFSLRYAGILSILIATVSNALYLINFKQQAQRIQHLVDHHFDPQHGWPKDPDVLSETEVRLLNGGKRSWNLKYTFLQKLPSFIGLFVGNQVLAFGIHWIIWIVVLYVLFCPAISFHPLSTFYVLVPVVFEYIFKKMLWGKIVSQDNGILQPRMYGTMDVILSLTSTVTGPCDATLLPQRQCIRDLMCCVGVAASRLFSDLSVVSFVYFCTSSVRQLLAK